MTRVTLSYNKYSENFSSETSYLIRIHGFPRILMQFELLENNGDVFGEAFEKYSPIYELMNDEIYEEEPSLQDLIYNDEIEELGELKSISLIGIISGSQVIIENSDFLSNWHKEFPSDFETESEDYSQILGFQNTYGEVIIIFLEDDSILD
jgi:hypothetical protein